MSVFFFFISLKCMWFVVTDVYSFCTLLLVQLLLWRWRASTGLLKAQPADKPRRPGSAATPRALLLEKWFEEEHDSGHAGTEFTKNKHHQPWAQSGSRFHNEFSFLCNYVVKYVLKIIRTWFLERLPELKGSRSNSHVKKTIIKGCIHYRSSWKKMQACVKKSKPLL